MIEAELYKLLAQSISKELTSEWSSRIVPVLKENGKLRLCIEYRHINNITTKENYPLPLIADILDKLAGKSIFSAIYATSGYYQSAMSECSAPKTAFCTRAMSMNLRGCFLASVTLLQHYCHFLMNCKVKKLKNFVLARFVDIIVFSNNMDDHTKHLEYVLSKIKEANIYSNKSKCKFCRSNIKALGNIISYNKVSPGPKKTHALQHF